MSGQNPKISVIVPIYNAERSFMRCINSILAQTFIDFELLLVDDGSTDGCASICDEYATLDPRVRVFHKENGGVSSARNLGLDNARGEWVAFCDSDDYVLPEWLANYLEGDDGNVAIISQGMIAKKNPGTPEAYEKRFLAGRSFVEDIPSALTLLFESGLGGYIGNKFYKHDLIESRKVRFREWIRYQEDEIFQYDYLRAGDKISYVDKAAYIYYPPEWEKKYSRAGQLDKNLLRFELLSQFIDLPDNSLRRYLEDECKLDLLDSCQCGSLSERIAGVERLRVFVKEHSNTIGLHPLLIQFIIYDRTYLLSVLAIGVNRFLRKMLRKTR